MSRKYHFLISAKYDGDLDVPEILKKAQKSLQDLGLEVDYNEMYSAEDWDSFVKNLKDIDIPNFSESVKGRIADSGIEEGLSEEDIKNIWEALSDNPKAFALKIGNTLYIKEHLINYNKMTIVQQMIDEILDDIYYNN